jgi:hypothetical protein
MQTAVSQFVLCEERNTNIGIREEKDVSSIQEVACGGMGWIDLAQDRDRCRAFVHVVMKLWVP